MQHHVKQPSCAEVLAHAGMKVSAIRSLMTPICCCLMVFATAGAAAEADQERKVATPANPALVQPSEAVDGSARLTGRALAYAITYDQLIATPLSETSRQRLELVALRTRQITLEAITIESFAEPDQVHLICGERIKAHLRTLGVEPNRIYTEAASLSQARSRGLVVEGAQELIRISIIGSSQRSASNPMGRYVEQVIEKDMCS